MAYKLINSRKKRRFTYFEDNSARQQAYLPLIKNALVLSLGMFYIC